VKAQAERLLSAPRAEPVIAAFFRRWLRLEAVRTAPKGADTPAFTPELREALVTSGLRATTARKWQRGGDQAALFGGPVVGNRAMSDFYGWSAPMADGFEELAPREPQKRFGVLTLPAVLGTLAHGADSHPVRRGHFVLAELMCKLDLPPAPPVTPPPDPAASTGTTRQRYEAQTSSGVCQACHRLFDPIGYGLENYDGYGRWRDSENGIPIDASGMGTVAGEPFDGPGGLAAILAGSPAVSRCLSRQWLRFALGRTIGVEDDCTLDRLERAFVAGGRQLRPLLLEIVTSDAFLTKRSRM
jgi:hypothetical protein